MNKNVKKVLFVLIIVALLGVFVYSAAKLGIYAVESLVAKGKYNELEQMRATLPTRPAITEPAQTQPDVTEGTDPTDATEPSPWVTVINPENGEEVQVLPEFEQLYVLNPDLVGWIEIPETDISYPVVQRVESIDYYLRRDFYGESATHGCIYVREQCEVFLPSDNLTIYGHRMSDGSMFADLLNYDTKSYFEKHPYIYFDTIRERHTYQIIAVFMTTATVGEGFKYHLFIDAADEEEFNDYVAECKRLSLYDTGVDAVYGDKLITLSTCEYSRVNGRFVVVAKRVA